MESTSIFAQTEGRDVINQRCSSSPSLLGEGGRGDEAKRIGEGEWGEETKKIGEGNGEQEKELFNTG